MLKAKKGNRVVRIPDEKQKEYQALQYQISDMYGNVIYKPEDPVKEVESLKAQMNAIAEENADLKEKLEEAEKYAESADKRIAELEVENANLKKAATDSPKKDSKVKQTDK